MIVCLPICSKDIAAMKALLAWCEKLGGCKGHTALVVADQAAPFDLVVEVLEAAKGVFTSAELITNHAPTSGWPAGPNSMFLAAARHCAEPFLWMEPDAIPLLPGWLDAIAAAWDLDCNALFMGHIYDCTQPFLPSRVMSGVAVYTPQGIGQMPFLPHSPRAWDVDGAEVMVSKGVHTPLIHHFWGQPDLPPIFVARKDAHSRVNAMTLADIPPEAVLFHRDKTHSLLPLLTRKLFPGEVRDKIAVCFPVYAGDIGLAIAHAKWMQRMGRKHAHKAIICHDPSCPVVLLNAFEQLLRVVFAEVESFVYPRPPLPTYPAAANFAFQSVAMHMARGKSPWFWFEADGAALKPDWIEQLQAEYDACGRAWMGSVVPHMGHMNGCGIYPPDAAQRMPGAMRCGAANAFDMAMKDDVIQDCHDSRLLFHLWTLLGRMAHPVGGGELPANITAAEVSRWLPKSAVFCHRVKDASLINLLLRGEFKP